MSGKLLLNCRALGHYEELDEGDETTRQWDVRDLSLTLHSRKRCQVVCTTAEQEEAVWRLLHFKLKPKAGGLATASGVHPCTDEQIWQRLSPGASLRESLASKLFEERPWLGGRRRFVNTLMDHLEMTPEMQRSSPSRLKGEMRDRFQLVLLIAARTRLVLLRKLLKSPDGRVQELLGQWAEGYLGGIFAFGKNLPFVCTHRLHVVADGRCHFENLTTSVEPS